MSKVAIDTSHDLEVFLKILAEESVASAKKSIDEDNEQKYFARQITADKNRFSASKMHEQEETEDQEPEVSADEGETESKEPKKDDVTFFKIRDELNTIRSGRSLKDKELRSELEQYVDRLDPDEKRVLHTFLKAIGNIMTDAVSGTDARDPSDPPTNLKVSQQKSQNAKSEKQSAPEDEDTTPPIKVGTQQTENIRKKIQKLMHG